VVAVAPRAVPSLRSARVIGSPFGGQEEDKINMRSVRLLLAIILPIILIAVMANAQSKTEKQEDLNRIRSVSKTSAVQSTSAEISGRWTKVAGKDGSFLQPVNSTHVLCGKPESMCTESLAWIGVGKGKPMLMVDTLEYRIIEWSATRIRATMAEPTGITFEIRIDRNQNTALRIVTVTDPSAAKKALGIQPGDNWRWSLQ